MLASMHLVRWPLGTAQVELWQARRLRRAFDAASFRSVLLPVALRYMPLPVGQVRAFGYLAVWPDADALEGFRTSALARRWRRAEQRLELTLQPIQSFGAWRGVDPLAGTGTEPSRSPTLLITHSRTRFSKLVPFTRRSGAVAGTLDGADGHIWADGFLDSLRTFDTGTLSLWRDPEAAVRFAYGEGVHREAVKAERAGSWFAESWFARLAVLDAQGSWPGLDLDQLG